MRLQLDAEPTDGNGTPAAPAPPIAATIATGPDLPVEKPAPAPAAPAAPVVTPAPDDGELRKIQFRLAQLEDENKSLRMAQEAPAGWGTIIKIR